ncbi:MAG: hypothetical protein JSU81_05160 [Candidatus Coatesbacteria bacterium]|nr:MAG: hypothetical protein JSU81_05160 [Candidatus Coatesbacteria bacterium]
MRARGLLVTAAVLGAIGTAAAAELVAPEYPESLRDKPFAVSVVVSGPVSGGKATDAEVLYSDGAEAFASAARAAFEENPFDDGRTRATLWYRFRLLQDTKVTDLSREAPRELEAPPELLESVAPEFPPGAPSLRMELALELLVGPDGEVWYASCRDEQADPLYCERALAAARRFKFSPATVDGEATAAWFSFTLEFR